MSITQTAVIWELPVLLCCPCTEAYIAAQISKAGDYKGSRMEFCSCLYWFKNIIHSNWLEAQANNEVAKTIEQEILMIDKMNSIIFLMNEIWETSGGPVEKKENKSMPKRHIDT